MQGAIELAIAAAVEAMTDGLAGGGLNRCGTGERGEGVRVPKIRFRLQTVLFREGAHDFGTHKVLRIYIQHYNRERPHRGLALQPPEPLQVKQAAGGDVRRHDRLGGLVHEYYRAAA